MSGSKVNYDKTRGMFLGKWKNRSDHPFGISWVKCHKILGYYFGYENCADETWSKVFLKFDNTLNLWRTRRLFLKGKSTVLNSLGLSKDYIMRRLQNYLLIMKLYYNGQHFDLFGILSMNQFRVKHCILSF